MVKFGNYIIKRFWIVLSVSFILLITGMVGFNQMPKKNMPNMNLPFALTTVIAPDETIGGITAEEFEHEYIYEIEDEAMDIDDMDSVTTTISKIALAEGQPQNMHFAMMVTMLDGGVNDSTEHWKELDEALEDTVSEFTGWPTNSVVEFDSDFKTPQGAFWVNSPTMNEARIIAEGLEQSLLKEVPDITELIIHDDSELKFSNMNNEEAIFVTYYLDDGIDQTKTRSDIKSVTDNLNNSIGDSKIITLSSEPDDVAAAIGGVMTNLLMALFIVGIVVFIGLGLMNAIGVVITIPVIILTTSAILWIFGREINTFTIAGIIISIGILVDNSIVISDSIQARIDNGTDKKTAAVKAIRDNWIPVAAATATTIAAFIPMLMLPGIAGKFIFMLPFTVMITIAVSYVAAMTLMPVISTFIFKKNEKRAKNNSENKLNKVETVINTASKWTLLHPIKTVVITVAVLFGTIAIAAPKMNFEMMPQAEISAITISYDDPNFNASEAQITHDKVSDVLDEFGWVENYASTVGGELPTFSSLIYSTKLQDYQGAFVIWIDDHYTNMDKYSSELNEKLKDENINVESNVVEMNFPGPLATVSISLEDDFEQAKYDELEIVAEKVYDEMVANTDLITDATINLTKDFAPVQRVDGKRVVTISLYSTTANEIEVGNALRDSVAKHIDDDLYDETYGGSYNQNSTMIFDLMRIFAIAMFVILAILVAQFRSFIKPFMVLSLVPFSFIGVLWIFLISGNALSMTGMIGIIALTGLVVNAGILLVEQVRDGQSDGMKPKEAIESAVMKRFRPITISACTTIVGLIPLAIAKDPFFTPMALIMIGGLLTSTLLALFTFPALLTFVTKDKKADKVKSA